jgi:nicotinate-nucleotide adenylyltransferase
MSKKKIIYGGTFDPIHNGHLKVAAYALEELDADELIFVPAKRSPFKKIFPAADANDRLEMIKIAISGRSNFKTSDFELKGKDPSYTIDTVERFKSESEPGTKFYLLVGADGAKELYKWYRINDLLEICTICLMVRPGFEVPDFAQYGFGLDINQIEKLKKHVLSNPLIDVSSTEIRSLVASGQDVSDKIPANVFEYIKTHHLYGWK